MEEKRYIKTVIETGYAGCTHEHSDPLPDNWDEMTEEEQEEYLNGLYEMHRDNCIEGSSRVEENK